VAAGGTPGGSDGQVQYNNGGSFGGASMYYNDSTADMGVGQSNPRQRLHVGGSPSTTNSYFGYMVTKDFQVTTTDASSTELASFTPYTNLTVFQVEILTSAVHDWDPVFSYEYKTEYAVVTIDQNGSVIGGATVLHAKDFGVGAATWTITYTSGGGAFKVNVVGDASSTVFWGCTLRIIGSYGNVTA